MTSILAHRIILSKTLQARGTTEIQTFELLDGKALTHEKDGLKKKQYFKS